MAKISIVIPVYNQNESLALVLRSIKQQTFKDIEVIVVDDGSVNPVSGELLRKTLGDFPHILVNQENAGASAARNKGFSLVRGEMVIFWDADLVAQPSFLEKMFQVLQDNPGLSFVYCNYNLANGRLMRGRLFSQLSLQVGNYIPTTSLIRCQDFPGFDESLKRFQDWDLWLTMLEHGHTGVWVENLLQEQKSDQKISYWLPRFAYHFPCRYLPGVCHRVRAYEEARAIVRRKHGLFVS